ncbi:MAG TPA: hypothetical protein VNT26_17805 [Candidatus Sulfotelmatobacter sp.]|nr:hypothetical protein [Candidatus Sulfotelmatobacter sp.]HWI57086.1 hypothetical protein [Bacillota bacterium]
MKHTLSTLCLLLALGSLIHAGDAKLDPSGTWKWNVANPDGRVPDITLLLKHQSGTVTGTILKSTGATPITNGAFKGDRVSFQTVREARSGKATTTYSGQLQGETIRGKVAMEAAGKTVQSDWEIKRIKP